MAFLKDAYVNFGGNYQSGLTTPKPEPLLKKSATWMGTISRRKHGQYLSWVQSRVGNAKKKPLNEFELYVLNDKIEVSSSESETEEAKEKSLQHINLPFEMHTVESNKHRRSQHLMRKKKITITDKLKSSMNVWFFSFAHLHPQLGNAVQVQELYNATQAAVGVVLLGTVAVYHLARRLLETAVGLDLHDPDLLRDHLDSLQDQL